MYSAFERRVFVEPLVSSGQLGLGDELFELEWAFSTMNWMNSNRVRASIHMNRIIRASIHEIHEFYK